MTRVLAIENRADWEFRIGDAFRLIRDVADNSIDLTVTSPPYNIGKTYEKRATLASYLSDYKPFIQNLYVKTASRGSVCWQVGNHVARGEVFPLDALFYPLFKEAGFKLRNRVIWHFGHGLHASKRFSGRYETILWFTKSDDYAFDLDHIRVPSKYPGKRAFKGDRKGAPSGNPLGKNPSDFWTVVSSDWDRLIWDIPNVKANHPEKTSHPCQFPVELVQRCVLGLSRRGDLVFDPFLGVGSSAVAALSYGRRFLGFELHGPYVTEARRRIKALEAGTLKLRPLGKPVYTPTGRERVAQLPIEWLSRE